jgi:hypothetical protein
MLEGRAYQEAPETRRYQDAWAAALSKHDKWQDVVDRLRPKLSDMSVSDTTAPGGMAAQRCCVYMTRLKYAERTKPYSIIVGLASVLVPHYHLYRILVDIRSGDQVRGPPLPRPHEGAEGEVADVVAKHLEQELGYKEFPPEFEAVPVPDICVGNLLLGEATLLDALFDENRGNLP